MIGKPYIVGIEDREYFYRPMWRMEIVFTIFYDLEVLFKVCLLQRQSTNDMKKIKGRADFLLLIYIESFFTDILFWMERVHFKNNTKI